MTDEKGRLGAEYYQLQCETIGRSDVWRHVSNPPNHNMAIWVFYPDVGNDDEGWGHIEVAYRNMGYGATHYEDRHGRKLDPQPLLWANINHPITPMIHETREGAMDAALKRITKVPGEKH